jgi:hypothetical protein
LKPRKRKCVVHERTILVPLTNATDAHVLTKCVKGSVATGLATAVLATVTEAEDGAADEAADGIPLVVATVAGVDEVEGYVLNLF